MGDDLATLLGLGVLSYALETMVHEGLGHGGMCLAQGHHVTVVTPLWMRCDVVSRWMVAAGPTANLAAALLSWLCLRSGFAAAVRLPLFFWLSFAFNGLVGAGYLGVGGATTFGDWAYLLGGIRPEWLWRTTAVAVSAAAYWVILRVAAVRYAKLAGASVDGYVRRVLVATAGAAAVAAAAQMYGQGSDIRGLVLPLACTLGIGASLWAVRDYVAASSSAARVRVAFSPLVVILALAAVTVYVFVIGR